MYLLYYCITLFLPFVFSCSLTHAIEDFDYYWRDYHGEIPEDAIPGGLDKNNKTTYIGTVPILEHGMFPTRIYPDVHAVNFSYYGIHSSDKFVKILCGHQPANFIWLPTKAADFQKTITGKHVVEGGTENNGILNIGRVQYQGEVIVGKISGYAGGDALLRFPYDNKEVYLDAYEVLVYENKEPLLLSSVENVV